MIVLNERQSTEHFITQCQVVDTMNKEIGSIEQNLGIINPVCSCAMEDDCKTKSRLIMAILCFTSFEIQSQCDLINVVSMGKEKFNRGVLNGSLVKYVSGTKDGLTCQLHTEQRKFTKAKV